MPTHLTVWGRSYNLLVILGLILTALLLGILNNLRVYEEQQVPWLGCSANEGEP